MHPLRWGIFCDIYTLSETVPSFFHSEDLYQLNLVGGGGVLLQDPIHSSVVQEGFQLLFVICAVHDNGGFAFVCK